MVEYGISSQLALYIYLYRFLGAIVWQKHKCPFLTYCKDYINCRRKN